MHRKHFQDGGTRGSLWLRPTIPCWWQTGKWSCLTAQALLGLWKKSQKSSLAFSQVCGIQPVDPLGRPNALFCASWWENLFSYGGVTGAGGPNSPAGGELPAPGPVQPGKGKNAFLWEKILVPCLQTASIFVWASCDFLLTSAYPHVSWIRFSERFPHLSLDLRWCQNNFRSVSLQVSGLALSRPCITIIWWFITWITSISVAASSEKTLIEYYEFKNILHVFKFSYSPKESVSLCSRLQKNRGKYGWEISRYFRGHKPVCLRNALFACLGLMFWQGWGSSFKCRNQISFKNVRISCRCSIGLEPELTTSWIFDVLTCFSTSEGGTFLLLRASVEGVRNL